MVNIMFTQRDKGGGGRGKVVLDLRFDTVADFDLHILHVVVLKGLARDAGVLLAQLQANDRTVFAYGVRPGQAGEADVDAELKN